MRGAMPPATNTPPVASTMSPRLPGDRPQHRAEDRRAPSRTPDRCRPARAGRSRPPDRGRPGAGQHGGGLGADEPAAGRLLGEEREHVDQTLAGQHALAGDAPVLDGQELRPGPARAACAPRDRRGRPPTGRPGSGSRPPTRAGKPARGRCPRPSTAIGPCATGGPPPSGDELARADRGDAQRRRVEVVDQRDARRCRGARTAPARRRPRGGSWRGTCCSRSARRCRSRRCATFAPAADLARRPWRGTPRRSRPATGAPPRGRCCSKIGVSRRPAAGPVTS